MSARYEPLQMIKYVPFGWAVFDTAAHQQVGDLCTWSAALAECARLNREIDPPPAPQPAAPCCDHAERLERIEAAFCRLLDGLEVIIETVGYPDQQEYAMRRIIDAGNMVRGHARATEESNG